MQGRQIYKGMHGEVFVRPDGQITFSAGSVRSDLVMSADQAAIIAMKLMNAVSYVCEQLAASMEDVPDAVEEAKESMNELQEQKDRFDSLE